MLTSKRGKELLAMSSEDKLKTLREEIYESYEFWLGCYESDNEHWKSGVLHVYRNMLAMIDNEGSYYKCPCHICKNRKEDK